MPDFSLYRSEGVQLLGSFTRFLKGRLKESRSDFSSRRLFQALGKRTLAIRSPVLHSDPRRLRIGIRSVSPCKERPGKAKNLP